jgi:aminomethyltransferase
MQGRNARTPEEIGLPHLAPGNRGWFSGRRAMVGAPAQRSLVALAVDADAIAAGAAVFAGDSAVGRITSAGFSPHLRRVVAFADVASAAAAQALNVAASSGPPRAAALLETPESLAAAAWRAAGRVATESGRWRVN